MGFSKLNSDGSALTNPGIAGSGCLIRDLQGAWVIGAYRHIPFATSVQAELWGLRDGLQLAKEANITKLVVEIDALAVVSLLN